jgi:hypothetical protein
VRSAGTRRRGKLTMRSYNSSRVQNTTFVEPNPNRISLKACLAMHTPKHLHLEYESYLPLFAGYNVQSCLFDCSAMTTASTLARQSTQKIIQAARQRRAQRALGSVASRAARTHMSGKTDLSQFSRLKRVEYWATH